MSIPAIRHVVNSFWTGIVAQSDLSQGFLIVDVHALPALTAEPDDQGDEDDEEQQERGDEDPGDDLERLAAPDLVPVVADERQRPVPERRDLEKKEEEEER
jgi:hypothetical protein